MLTQAERDEEAKLTAKEQAKPAPRPTGADWKRTAEAYLRHGKTDCCYNCEAGRAYMRAAADFRRRNLPDDAAEAMLAAAYAYLLCGDLCAETGDFFCASSGFSLANLIFRRLAKDYQAAGNPAADDMKKMAERAARGVRKIDEYERMTDF